MPNHHRYSVRLIPVDSFHYWLALVLMVHATPWLLDTAFQVKWAGGKDDWAFFGALVLWVSAFAAVSGAWSVFYRYYRLARQESRVAQMGNAAVPASGSNGAPVNTAAPRIRYSLFPSQLAYGVIIGCALLGGLVLVWTQVISLPSRVPLSSRPSLYLACPMYALAMFVPSLIAGLILQGSIKENLASNSNEHSAIEPKDRWEWAIWVATAMAAFTYGVHSTSHGGSHGAESEYLLDASGVYGASAYKLAEASVISVISIFFTSFVTSAQHVETTIAKAAENFGERSERIASSADRIKESVQQVEAIKGEMHNASDKLVLAGQVQEMHDAVGKLVESGADGKRMSDLRQAMRRNVGEVFKLLARDIRKVDTTTNAKKHDTIDRSQVAQSVASVTLYATFFRALVERLNRRTVLLGEEAPHIVRMETSFGHYCAAVRQVLRELTSLQASVDNPYRFEYHTTFDGDPLSWLDPWVWMQRASEENQQDPQWLIFLEIFSRWLCTKDVQQEFHRTFLVPEFDQSDREIVNVHKRFDVEILCRKQENGEAHGRPIIVWNRDETWARSILKPRDSTAHYRRLWDLDSQEGQSELARDLWKRVRATEDREIADILGALVVLYRTDQSGSSADRAQLHDVPEIDKWPVPSYVYRHRELRRHEGPWNALESATSRTEKYEWLPLKDVVAGFNPQQIHIRAYPKRDKPNFDAFWRHDSDGDPGYLTDVFAVRQVPKDPNSKEKPRWVVCMAAEQSGDHGSAVRLYFATPQRGRDYEWANITSKLDRWFPSRKSPSVDPISLLGKPIEWPASEQAPCSKNSNPAPNPNHGS